MVKYTHIEKVKIRRHFETTINVKSSLKKKTLKAKSNVIYEKLRLLYNSPGAQNLISQITSILCNLFHDRCESVIVNNN